MDHFCKHCQKVQPEDNFTLRSKGASGWIDSEGRKRYVYCKSCPGRTVRRLLEGARKRAKDKGLECTLTMADIKVPERCPVLGIVLKRGVKLGQRRGPIDESPSLDRIDNSKGYTPENTVVVSWLANRLKNAATVGQLRAIADFYSRFRSDQNESVPG